MFKKQQLRSLPLQDLPSRTNLLIAIHALRYLVVAEAVEFGDGDCDATRRQ